MPFHAVEANLRESFRILAAGRPAADVLELPGLTIASVGVAFQMFNAAFLSGGVADTGDLADRVNRARAHFARERKDWSFWFCDDWLARSARRNLSAVCEKNGLRHASAMPGMIADAFTPRRRQLPPVDFRRVDGMQTLSDFRSVGSRCFHVPPEWFGEVFDDSVPASRPRFQCWVGYLEGLPVATGASVISDGVAGLYNIATHPEQRGKGVAEAITRHVAAEARRLAGPVPLILQSSPMGLPLYRKLGFRAVTEIVVYNSIRHG